MLSIRSAVFVLLALFATSAHAQTPARAKAETSAPKPSLTVNVNTATAAEFEQLPGIGAKVAARIVDYRTKKGPFKKIEEIMETSRSGANSLRKRRFTPHGGVSRSR